MSPSPDAAEAAPLPDDVATLKALLLAERAAAAKLSGQNEHLRAIIKELQRAVFGRRSEKTAHPDQLQLALEDLEQAIAEGEAETEKSNRVQRAARPRQRRVNRGALPKHLPRHEVVIEPEEQTCPCCGGAMHRIGEDVAERLDVVPAQFRVIVTRRPKYGCRACESAVVQAPAPARLIEGGLPTEALVAHVLVGKYADHLPLYRQSQIYARQGIELDRSTLADWVGRAAAELRPVHQRLFEHLKRSAKLFMDETRAPVLDPGRRAGGPRAATCGRSPATTGRGAAPIRRRSPISMPRAAAPRTRSGRSPGSPASFRWTATPATRPWPIPGVPAAR
jgi:transposase